MLTGKRKHIYISKIQFKYLEHIVRWEGLQSSALDLWYILKMFNDVSWKRKDGDSDEKENETARFAFRLRKSKQVCRRYWRQSR